MKRLLPFVAFAALAAALMSGCKTDQTGIDHWPYKGEPTIIQASTNSGVITYSTNVVQRPKW